ncbi:hypothetical protein H4S02_013571, partial [Coemansia sp. RSA 2611]
MDTSALFDAFNESGDDSGASDAEVVLDTSVDAGESMPKRQRTPSPPPEKRARTDAAKAAPTSKDAIVLDAFEEDLQREIKP